MKQGNNSLLKVKIDEDFDDIEKIEFIFVQGTVRKKFVYPGTKVTRISGENAVNISFSAEDTYDFVSGANIMMDTRIKLTGIETNPETTIATFEMNPTLFRRADND